jgi:hypothetical protein
MNNIKWVREDYGFGNLAYKSEVGYIQKVVKPRNPACRSRKDYFEYQIAGKRFSTLAQAKKFAEKVGA